MRTRAGGGMMIPLMRHPVRRHFFKRSAAVLSLLLWAATAALWVRSYFTSDYLSCVDTSPGLYRLSGVQTYRGGFHCTMYWFDFRGRAWTQTVALDRIAIKSLKYEPDGEVPRLAGVGCARDPGKARVSSAKLIIPHWCVCSILVVVGMRMLRQRRHPGVQHCCATCGYDLRATPSRCPECGTAVDPAVAEVS